MGIIKDRFKVKADKVSAEIKEMLKEHGNKVIGEVQLSQIYQGMRGITWLFYPGATGKTGESTGWFRTIARRIILPDAGRRVTF